MQELSFKFLAELREEHREEIDSGVEIVLAVTQMQLWDWFAKVDYTRSYYNELKALTEGNITYILGFKFKVIKTDKKVEIDLTSDD